MAFGSRAAGRADVEFRADTGKFRSDVNEARQVYERSTGQMSDQALRMAVAQEKLDRAIDRYGAESRQAKQATLSYRSEMRALQTQTDRTGREVDQTRRSLDRMGRGALAGTGLFQGFARSIAFASSAFLGGAGLIYAIRSTINAAKEEELVLGQTRAAVEATGLEWDRYRARIDAVVRAQSKFGFDDEQLLKTFSTFVRRTGDVNKALERNALAIDVARGRYIDLEQAATIVLKASLGQAGALRRIGIEAEKGASGVELLRMLTEKYAGSAESASKTATGAQDRFNVALENTQEVIGRGLLPTLTDLLNRGADYLDQLSESGELQRKVNEGVEAGTEAVRGITSALRTVRAVGEPVVDALGGIENAARAATLLWVAWKVKAIAGFAATATASALTRTKILADAAAIGTALDVATRPRNVIITTSGIPGGTTTGAPRGGGGGGGGRKGGGGWVRVGGVLATGLASVGPQAAYAAAIFALTRDKSDDPRHVGYVPRGERHEGMAIFFRPDSKKFTYGLTDEVVPRALLFKWGIIEVPPPKSGLRGYDEGPERASAPARGRGRGRRGGGARTETDILLDLAREQAQRDPRGQLHVLRELRALYQRQIDALEARKNLNDEQKERLRELYGQIASTQSQIEAIIEEGERKLDEQREKAEEKRRQREEARQKRLDAVFKQNEARRKRWRDQIKATVAPNERLRREARLRPDGSDERLTTKADRDRIVYEALLKAWGIDDPGLFGRPEPRHTPPVTFEQMHALVFDALRGFRSMLDQFGSNITPSGDMGQVATHAYVQTELLREQNRLIGTLTRGMWFPGAGYSRTQLSAAGLGSGF